MSTNVIINMFFINASDDGTPVDSDISLAFASDLHLALNGVNQQLSFRDAIADINADAAIEGTIIPGDLVDNNSATGKSEFATEIANLNTPHLLCRGNHSVLSTFAADYGQSYEGSSNIRWLQIIRIDNSWEQTGPGQYSGDSAKDHMGRFSVAQMTQLQADITAAVNANRKVLIVHHVTREKRTHPHPGYGMSAGDRLNYDTILTNNAAHIVGIVSGHNHRPLSIWTDHASIPEIVVPNTWGNVDPAPTGNPPPYYAAGHTVPSWTKLTFRKSPAQLTAVQYQINGNALATFTI